MTPQERLLKTAREQVGYVEKKTNSQLDSKTANAGYNNFTKYARDLDNLKDVYNGRKNGYDWCDVFCDWCFITTFGEETGMKLLCQAYKGLGAGVGYSANYYKQKGQFHTNNPQPGDQIFFKNARGPSHTGIVEKVANGKVYTIEGNAGTNSNKVVQNVYNLTSSYIYGYGRPDWSIVKDDNPDDYTVVNVNWKGEVVTGNDVLMCRTEPNTSATVVTKYANGTKLTITKESNNWGWTGIGWSCLDYIKKIDDSGDEDEMTYDDWKKFMQQYRKEMQDNDSSNWSESDREWAIKSGLIKGNGQEIEGIPNYMWQDFLSREQVVSILHRFAEQRGLE